MSIIGVIVITLLTFVAGFIVGLFSGIVTEREHIKEQLLVQGYKLKFDPYTSRITVERMGNSMFGRED